MPPRRHRSTPPPWYGASIFEDTFDDNFYLDEPEEPIQEGIFWSKIVDKISDNNKKYETVEVDQKYNDSFTLPEDSVMLFTFQKNNYSSEIIHNFTDFYPKYNNTKFSKIDVPNFDTSGSIFSSFLDGFHDYFYDNSTTDVVFFGTGILNNVSIYSLITILTGLLITAIIGHLFIIKTISFKIKLQHSMFPLYISLAMSDLLGSSLIICPVILGLIKSKYFTALSCNFLMIGFVMVMLISVHTIVGISVLRQFEAHGKLYTSKRYTLMVGILLFSFWAMGFCIGAAFVMRYRFHPDSSCNFPYLSYIYVDMSYVICPSIVAGSIIVILTNCVNIRHKKRQIRECDMMDKFVKFTTSLENYLSAQHQKPIETPPLSLDHPDEEKSIDIPINTSDVDERNKSVTVVAHDMSSVNIPPKKRLQPIRQNPKRKQMTKPKLSFDEKIEEKFALNKTERTKTQSSRRSKSRTEILQNYSNWQSSNNIYEMKKTRSTVSSVRSKKRRAKKSRRVKDVGWFESDLAVDELNAEIKDVKNYGNDPHLGEKLNKSDVVKKENVLNDIYTSYLLIFMFLAAYSPYLVLTGVMVFYGETTKLSLLIVLYVAFLLCVDPWLYVLQDPRMKNFVIKKMHFQ